MQRTILLFAGLRQLAGKSELHLDLPGPITALALKQHIAGLYPQLTGPLASCRVAAGLEFVDDQQELGNNGEIALIPPVSGGIDMQYEPTHSLLSDQPLSVDAILARVSHRLAGGINLFIGQVRENSRNKVVTHLDYEAYPAMALHVMDSIARKIESEIAGTRVSISHRVGTLAVGEIAVIVAASAAHRAESFAACRQAIEALKEHVPIWKKEFADDGGVWIGQGP